MLTGNLVKLEEVINAKKPLELVLKEAIETYIEWHHPLFKDVSETKRVLAEILDELKKEGA